MYSQDFVFPVNLKLLLLAARPLRMPLLPGTLVAADSVSCGSSSSARSGGSMTEFLFALLITSWYGMAGEGGSCSSCNGEACEEPFSSGRLLFLTRLKVRVTPFISCWVGVLGVLAGLSVSRSDVSFSFGCSSEYVLPLANGSRLRNGGRFLSMCSLFLGEL